MPPPRRQLDLVDSLATAAPLATRWIERLLATHDQPMTVAQYLALRAVSVEQLTAGELARRAGVSAAAVSQLLAGLQEFGWVARSPTPDDRRSQGLLLTPAGREVLARASELLRARIGPLLELPRPEQLALARSLERLEAALAGTAPPRRPRPPGPKHPRRP